MKNAHETAQDVLDGMTEIGGVPSNKEFYNEFDARLRAALGFDQRAILPEKWQNPDLKCPGIFGEALEDYSRENLILIIHNMYAEKLELEARISKLELSLLR